ncbi:MAG: hypothetical protein ACQERB_00200 [Promethearchaeati archaeon]
MSKWTIEDFTVDNLGKRDHSSIDIDLTEKELDYIKEAVIEVIDDKLLSTDQYVAMKFQRMNKDKTRKDIMLEYNLVLSVFNDLAELEYLEQSKLLRSQGEPVIVRNINTKKFISLDKFNEILGIDRPNTNIKDGIYFDPITIERALKYIHNKIGEIASYYDSEIEQMPFFLKKKETAYLSLQLDILMDLYDELNYYAKERGLSLFMDSNMPSLENKYFDTQWNDERVRSYHIIFGLCEFLGFDPLFFEALDKEIFETGDYRRHHFRDSPIRKVSSNARDVIITDSRKHNDYEKYEEGFMVAVMNAIKEVMFNDKIPYSDKNGIGGITAQDLRVSLEKHMKLYFDLNQGSDGKVNPFIVRGLNQPGERNYRDERLTYKQLVGEVWSLWNGADPTQGSLDEWTNADGSIKVMESFKNQLKEFNRRRYDFLKDGKYKEFLEKVYNMADDPNMNSRFIEGAEGMDSLLQDPKTPKRHYPLYTDAIALDLIRKALGLEGSAKMGKLTASQINRLYDSQFTPEYLHERIKAIYKV